MNVELNDLPNEVLSLIFRRLDLFEKLKLRHVCLRWKWIIEDLNINDVSIVDSSFNTSESWTCFGLESFKCQNLIYWNSGRRLSSLLGAKRSKGLTGSLRLVSKHPMFSRLKSMFISFDSIRSFCFQKYVNPYFPKLEQLSCYRMSLADTCLSLPKLKVLSLCSMALRSTKPIRLELPSLDKFFTSLSLESFEFVHPHSVTHLFSLNGHKSISQLSNLEYLACYKLDPESVKFADLTKLKEIHLHYQKNSEQNYAAIHRTKQRQGRFELKMYVNEIGYEVYRNFPALSFKQIIRSYAAGKMAASPIVSLNPILVSDDLLDTFEHRGIPSDFKWRFSNIRIIRASRRTRDDVNWFFQLLGLYPNLYILELESAFDRLSDEQSCYDLLPLRCRYLRVLKLHLSDDRTTAINLNFVLNFSFLQKLKINFIVKPSFIRLLFEKLKYFRKIRILNGKSKIKVTKICNSLTQKYRLSMNSKRPKTLPSFRLLAFYLKKIERDRKC